MISEHTRKARNRCRKKQNQLKDVAERSQTSALRPQQGGCGRQQHQTHQAHSPQFSPVRHFAFFDDSRPPGFVQDVTSVIPPPQTKISNALLKALALARVETLLGKVSDVAEPTFSTNRIENWG